MIRRKETKKGREEEVETDKDRQYKMKKSKIERRIKKEQEEKII